MGNRTYRVKHKQAVVHFFPTAIAWCDLTQLYMTGHLLELRDG